MEPRCLRQVLATGGAELAYSLEEGLEVKRPVPVVLLLGLQTETICILCVGGADHCPLLVA